MRPSLLVGGPAFIALALAGALDACGGPPFTAGAADAGAQNGDSTAPPPEASAADGPLDAVVTSDGGGDAMGGPDALPDVIDEPPPPSCSGAFACVPAVPAGWSGPVELYEGAGAAPACSTDFATVYGGNDQLAATPASCSCSCDITPTGCGSTNLGFSISATCTTVQCFSAIMQSGACVKVNDQPACSSGGGLVTTYLTASNPVASTGSCTPQTAKQIPAPTWGTVARACSSTIAVAQVDCQAGS
ncbi:MAG: hypothetical protein ACRELB_21245, partial [Polyangiaceae bacterium]